jgi:hypothetical protein
MFIDISPHHIKIFTMSIHAIIPCPTCLGPLTPTQLRCHVCDLTISGTFATNEFASLPEEELHFLRIFILCEGRIRDMESALGVSYPTIKARLAQLKSALAARRPATDDADPAPPVQEATQPNSPAAVLQSLRAGELSYEQAIKTLKQNANSFRKDPS